MNKEQNINQLPKGWKWEKFGDVVNNLDGKRRPLSKEVRAKRKGNYRYYGATEIVDYIDDYIFEGEHLLVGEDGANLLSKSKALAFIVDGKFWVNNHAHVLKAKETSVNKYLCYYFNSFNLAKFVTGTAQPKLTQGNLNKIEIPICSTKTQNAIVSKIEELFSELDIGIENLRTAQQQLKTYRQSVLNTLITRKNYQTIESVLKRLDQGWSPRCENEASTDKTEWAVIKTSAVQYGHFLEFENKRLPKELKPREQHELMEGDILITRAGPRVRVGVCCMVRHTRPKLINCDKVYRIKVTTVR